MTIVNLRISKELNVTQTTALQKRIKRHIIGPDHLFFIATEPHLNQICLDELKSILPDIKEAITVNGGVEFTGRLTDCYLANLKLRTANRILMRISDFKASNFSQLEKKINLIPWELYLSPRSTIQVNVTTQKSRLYHKEAVKEHVINGITKQMPELLPDDTGQQIFIRGVEDRFTVSLDSSGDLLYKRGIKSHGHKAPLRETLAAAALMISGYQTEEPLIDPMCGSGTFSFEAGLMAQNIPPGWFRQFEFMKWPAFKPNQWKHLKKAEKQKQIVSPCASIFASDTDEITCENLKTASEASGLANIIQVQTRDFFSFHPSEVTTLTGLVAINPPYGLRLQFPKAAAKFFKTIITHLATNYKLWKFILFIPYKNWLEYIPFDHDVFPIFHGGLTVYLVTGRI